MLKGTSYIKNLTTSYATVFEALYCIATTIGSWPAALKTLAALHTKGNISLEHCISYRRTPIEAPKIAAYDLYEPYESTTSKFRTAYTYTVSIEIHERLPKPCITKILEYASNPDLASKLSQYRVIDGTPACGITEFDEYVLISHEINSIVDGLDGLMMKELFNALQNDFQQELSEKDQKITRLRDQINESSEYDREVNSKSKGFVGKVLLACARNIIGDSSKSMPDTKITRLLIERLSAARSTEIATDKGLLPYIQAGMAKEEI